MLTVGSTDQEAAFYQGERGSDRRGSSLGKRETRNRINLVSDLPFADELPLDAISLDGDFQGFVRHCR